MKSQGMAHPQHETFEVKQGRRLIVVRQDRLEAADGEVFVEVDGKKIPVIDYSTFGLALAAPTSFNLQNEFYGVFVFQNVEVATLHLRIARIESLQQDKNKLALEVIGEPLDTETVTAIKLANDLIREEKSKILSDEAVPEGFRNVVYEMKDYLENIRNSLEAVESVISKNGNRYANAYQDTIAQIVGKYMDEVFPNKYSKASSELAECSVETIKKSVEFFRSKMQELLYKAPIAERIYNKPLGYAGDFEMMNIIYKTDVAGRSLFEKCIHNFFIRNPAAQAVRNRSQYLCKTINELIKSKGNQEVKILSLACGPAREIQMLFDKKLINENTRLTIHLLDQDETALKHAQLELKKRYKGEHSIKIEYIHAAIKNVVARGLNESDYDLIYTAGLFDYFSDAVAQITSQKLMESLREDGKLLIGNFDINNPGKPIMEIALDWHLIYRSEDDLKRLFGQLGRTFHVEKEQLGINLFCVVTR